MVRMSATNKKRWRRQTRNCKDGNCQQETMGTRDIDERKRDSRLSTMTVVATASDNDGGVGQWWWTMTAHKSWRQMTTCKGGDQVANKDDIWNLI